MKPPTHPLPEPLRAIEKPSFTHYSVVIRLPNIARRTLVENNFPSQTVAKINALIEEIPLGKIRPVEIPENGVTQDWDEYVRPFQGMDWLEIPWFFAEEYFYIRMLEATGYFEPGSWHRRDPYAQQKQLGLESTREDIFTLTKQIAAALENPVNTYPASLSRLLLADLWGNQNDLSLWPVQQDSKGQALTGGSAANKPPASSAEEMESSADLRSALEHLLVDDRPALLTYLSRLKPNQTRVDILLDNAGYELVADLALADFLLTSQIAVQVVLHGKSHPVFVSDALDRDIHNTLDFLTLAPHEPTRAMAIRLRQRLVNEQLELLFNPFWVSPLAAWQMPDALSAYLNSSSLVISKGDANYRRLLGDRHWPLDLPFPDVVNYFKPAVLSLRTLKSEIAVGIPRDRIPTEDPDWMSNGRWGLIQFTTSGRAP